MATQSPKRRHADDRERPPKKTKTGREATHKAEREAWANWQYPPEFWDRLSKISLTRRAVREHNRRVRLQRCVSRPPPVPNVPAEQLVHTFPAASLARFAKLGGPDLTDLRGYPEPPAVPKPFVAMSTNQPSRSQAMESVDPASTVTPSAETKTTRSKKSSAYNRDFDLHLVEHGVHPVYSSQRPDLTDIRAALAVPRPSLSPSKFSEGAFEAFQEMDARAKDDDDVLANVMPAIIGPPTPAHPSGRNVVFRNLESLTDGTIAPAAPDIYYGAQPEGLCRPARDALRHHIMPSTMESRPLAPNFFVEVKGPDGSAAVASRQIRYDGAYGARAMHSLQNYGTEGDLQYDGQSYTISSVYHAGQLQLYAHHPTAPISEGGRPEYHMTQVGTWATTGNIDSFRRGATAFRNARDLAKQHRDGFIQAANAKASHPRPSASHTNPPGWWDGDEALQQDISNAYDDNFGDGGEEAAIPQGFYTGEDSVDDASLEVAASFTPGVSSAKRSRQQTVHTRSHSGGDHSPKSHRQSRKKRTAESTTAAGAQPGSEFWHEAE